MMEECTKWKVVEYSVNSQVIFMKFWKHYFKNMTNGAWWVIALNDIIVGQCKMNMDI